MVRLVPDVKQKFILVSLSDGEDTLFGDPKAEYHKDITTGVTEAGYEIAEVYGGGKLFYGTQERKIWVWGRSTIYGEFSFTTVKRLLETEFPGGVVVNEELVD